VDRDIARSARPVTSITPHPDLVDLLLDTSRERRSAQHIKEFERPSTSRWIMSFLRDISIDCFRNPDADKVQMFETKHDAGGGPHPVIESISVDFRRLTVQAKPTNRSGELRDRHRRGGVSFHDPKVANLLKTSTTSILVFERVSKNRDTALQISMKNKRTIWTTSLRRSVAAR